MRLGLLAVILLAPLSVRADQNVVAVFDVEARGVRLSKDAVDRLSGYLTGRVAAAGGFQVIPRTAIKGRLSEQKKVSFQACYDEACQIEIGKELAAEKILDPQVIKIGGICTVTLALIDLRKATTERATSADGACTEEGIAASLKSAVGELAAAKPVERSEGTTRCEIDLGAERCPGDPSLASKFDDDVEKAGSDQPRCLRRAREYFDWCGKMEPAIARFFAASTPVAEERAQAPTTCQIVLGEEGCPATKDRRFAFNDYAEGAEANEARCMKRAREYFDWCGKGIEAKARFTSGGKVVREERAHAASRCEIAVGDEGCPAYGDARVVFNDSVERSDVDPARCVRRAREFFDWCGKKTAVVARFLSGGKVVREERALPTSRCEIALGKEGCPATGDVRSVFNDAHESADTDAARCMKRALEFYHWCGKAELVTARFYSGDKLVQEQRAKTQTRCEIVSPQGCPATSDARRRWNDDWDGSGSNGPRCLRRAREYFDWCGASSPVSANYFFEGNVTHQETWNPATWCQISLPTGGCPASRDTRVRFNDDHEGSGSNSDRCLRRASEWRSWCKIGGRVEARFFSGGREAGIAAAP